jgi:thymidylate kinase
MPLVYFFGPDGSGKSSIAIALVEVLRARGTRVRLSWMRGTHTLASFLARVLGHFSIFKGEDNPNYMITIPPKMRRLWQLVEVASMLPVLMARYSLPSFMGYTVVGERYIPDFVVWVTLTTNDAHYPESFSARFLLVLSLKSQNRTYVTAAHSRLVERRRDSNPAFLMRQLQLYGMLARAIGAQTLDTTYRTIEESTQLLLNFIDLNR